MRNKLIIIIVAIILVIGSLIAYENTSNNDRQYQIGKASIIIPEGYHADSLVSNDDFNRLNITKNQNVVYIVEFKGNNLKEYINHYINLKYKENKTVTMTNFNVNDVVVYKGEVNGEPNNLHYWFLKNNIPYQIYTSEGNSETDNLVKEIISSMEFSFI